MPARWCHCGVNLRSILLSQPYGDTGLTEGTVTRYSVSDHDNRNNEQMYGYLEARIEALKNRLYEVEKENRDLRNQLQRSPSRMTSNPAKHVATAA